MQKFFLSILLLFISSLSYGQTSELDELPLDVLRQKLAVSTNDTITVKLQLALGHLMFYKAIRDKRDIDSAMNFATQAALLSRRLNYHFGIINAMLLRAETFYNLDDRETGLKTAERALAFSKMHNNSEGQSRSYHLIAQYFPKTDPIALQNRIFYINKAIIISRKEENIPWLSFMLTQNAQLLLQAERPTEGLRLLFEALDLGTGVSRRTVEGIYWNIGVASFKLGDYNNALKYHLLSLEVAKEVNDTSVQLCLINHLIASTYIKLQNYGHAIPYSLEVLRLAERYKATEYIKSESSALALEYTHTNQLPKALAILTEMNSKAGNVLDKLSVNVDFLSNLIDAKQIAHAGQYALEVKRLLAQITPRNVPEIMNAYKSLSSYYSETDQAKLAYHYTELYAAMARKLNSVAGIGTAENRYYKLVTLKGDMKSAIEPFLREQGIRDSAENIVKDYQIFLLDMQNKTLEKNKHIDSLTAKAQISNIKLKRQQLIQKVTIGGSIMLLIITGLTYSRYRLKQRSNRSLAEQQKELDQKNSFLETMNAEQNKLLKEKEWLIREVHHRVKNNLQMVTSLLNTQTTYLQDESAVLAVKDSLRRMEAMSLIHQKLYKEENISTIAMPEYIDELVRYLKESFDTGSRIIFERSICQISLDISQAIPLGLIINESIVNAIKYAFPSAQKGIVNIQLHPESDHLVLRISDNGIGLPAGVDIKIRNSLGFDLMHGLTKQLNSSLLIESNNGVHVIVRFIPLNK